MSNKPDIDKLHLVQMIKADTGERTEPAVLTLAELSAHLKQIENEKEPGDDSKIMLLILGSVEKDNQVEYSQIPLMYTNTFHNLVEMESAKQGATNNG